MKVGELVALLVAADPEMEVAVGYEGTWGYIYSEQDVGVRHLPDGERFLIATP